MITDRADYHVHIRPRRSLWSVDWHGIIQYRDLLWLLVRRDFVSKYKQTVLGPAWMIVQPLTTTAVFTLVFSKVGNIPTNGTSPALFYMSGLLAWNLFAQTLSSSGNVLQANAHLFGKVYFPRIVVPIANTVSAFIPFIIQVGLFFVCYVVLGSLFGVSHPRPLSWHILVFPLFAIQAAVIGVGVALIISSLTAVYRDVQHLLSFLITIWMYVTPVIIPLNVFAERWSKWMWLVQMNPMTVPVEGMRWSLLGAGAVSPSSLIFSWLLALAILAGGFLWFNNIERSFVDRA
jgi:lipopolysaccharide transport system permease protein